MVKLERRDFLKVFGAATGALLLPSRDVLIAQASGSSPCDAKGVLVDLTKCIGCGWCQRACNQANGLPAEEIHDWSVEQEPLPLSADTWTLVAFKDLGTDDRVFAKRQCMHCLHPACVSACPVSALEQNEYGAVVYDADRCIGCRYCMVACPFGVPKIEWDKPIPLIRKCTFCSDRQDEGLEPACTEACPTEALLFGERAALIAEARARIEAHPGEYVDHIYGEHELGGTSWMYISPVPFVELGFPALGEETVTGLSETVAMFGTPTVALGVALFLSSIYYRSKSKAHSEE
jgi:formate dehydrogenase iron-sulfur subunit